MSGGPVAVIRWLAIVPVVSVVVFGGIIVLLGITGLTEPDADQENISPTVSFALPKNFATVPFLVDFFQQ